MSVITKEHCIALTIQENGGAQKIAGQSFPELHGLKDCEHGGSSSKRDNLRITSNGRLPQVNAIVMFSA